MRALIKNPAGRASKAFSLASERPGNGQLPLANQAPLPGIDIGCGGAIALLTSNGELLDAVEMPCLNDGPAGRRTVNGSLPSEIITKAHASMAYVELVLARPREGAVGAFALRRSRGMIEAILAALRIRLTHLSPSSWKRAAIGLAAGREGAKDAARSVAIRRWPDKAAWFAPKCDDDRAEAALIAVAGLLREAAR